MSFVCFLTGFVCFAVGIAVTIAAGAMYIRRG